MSSNLFARLVNPDAQVEDRFLVLHPVAGSQEHFLTATEMLSFASTSDDRVAILNHGGFWSQHTLNFKEFNMQVIVYGKPGETIWDIDTRVKRVLQVGTVTPLRLEVGFESTTDLRYIEVRPTNFSSTVRAGSAAAPYVEFRLQLRAVQPWWQSSAQTVAELTLEEPLEDRTYTQDNARGIEFGSTTISPFRSGMDWDLPFPSNYYGLDFDTYQSSKLLNNRGSVEVEPRIEIEVPSTADATNVLTVRIVGSPTNPDGIQTARFANLATDETTIFEPTDLTVTAGGTNSLAVWTGTSGANVRVAPKIPAGKSNFNFTVVGNMEDTVVRLVWRDRWH